MSTGANKEKTMIYYFLFLIIKINFLKESFQTILTFFYSNMPLKPHGE